MDWKKLLADLADAGVTQSDIADKCGVSQASVSDLKTGKTLTPNFDFGSRLVALHQSLPKAKQAA